MSESPSARKPNLTFQGQSNVADYMQLSKHKFFGILLFLDACQELKYCNRLMQKTSASHFLLKLISLRKFGN